jgi:hypothetical protein
MVRGEGDKVCVDKDNVLEVVDDRLAVQEVVGHNEEVPADELSDACKSDARLTS